jgi:hypothetical protein
MQLKEGEERLNSYTSPFGLFTHEVATFCAPGSSSPATPQLVSLDTKQEVARVDNVKSAVQSQWKARKDPRTLGDISRLLRSKNAGPYEITLDVMFESEAEYRLVKQSSMLNASSMAELFRICEDDIIWNGFFDQALAYKVTVPRLRNGKPMASGGYMENDVHASQQYIAFMNLALPEVLIKKWNEVQQEEESISSKR